MAPLGPDLDPHAPELLSGIVDGRAAVGAALRPSEAPTTDSGRIVKLCRQGDTNAARKLLEDAEPASLTPAAALALIQAGEAWEVALYIDNFSGLDKEIALALIQADQVEVVANNLDQFSDLDREVALVLIQVGETGAVIQHLNAFSGLDKEIALALIQAGEALEVALCIDNFSGLDRKEMALCMIQAGQAYAVARCLDNFPGLDKEIAIALIQAGEVGAVTQHLDQFSGLDIQVARALIQAGKVRAVADSPGRFSGLDYRQITSLVMRAGHYTSTSRQLASGILSPAIVDACILEDVAYHDALFDFALYRPSRDAAPLIERLWALCREHAAARDALSRCIDRALAESDYALARRFANLFHENTGYICSPEQEQALQQAAERIEDPVDLRLPERAISVPDEIVQFYAMEYVQATLMQLQQQAQSRGQEFSLKNQLIMRSAQSAIDQTQHALAAWLSSYLVEAVQSEIKHVEDANQAPIPEATTPSRVRVYLRQAACIFNNSDFSPGWGGPSWARIAQLAAQYWREPDLRQSESILIDSAFHIEHNSGFVFDKAQDRVKHENSQQRQLLDMKRDAADWRAFRAGAVRLLGAEPEYLQRVDHIMQQLQQVRPQPRGRD